MSARFVKTSLPGLVMVEPAVYHDARGFFLETYHYRKYQECGIQRSFVQDNQSHSRRGTLRGLHYQLRQPQGKLVYVVTGEIYDVAVDIRVGSPTFGQWVGTILSAENKTQIYVPEGFAHGFCVISTKADVIYKCTDFYAPGDEYGILWADPCLAIDWPIKEPLLSSKDSQNPLLNSIPETSLPVYQL